MADEDSIKAAAGGVEEAHRGGRPQTGRHRRQPPIRRSGATASRTLERLPFARPGHVASDRTRAAADRQRPDLRRALGRTPASCRHRHRSLGRRQRHHVHRHRQRRRLEDNQWRRLLAAADRFPAQQRRGRGGASTRAIPTIVYAGTGNLFDASGDAQIHRPVQIGGRRLHVGVIWMADFTPPCSH